MYRFLDKIKIKISHDKIQIILHPLMQITLLGLSVLIFYLTRKAWIETAWETFGPINLPGEINILLLPTSIFYVPFMNRIDLVGVFCLLNYYLCKRFHLKNRTRIFWIIAMWVLYLDNLIFYVHKSSFLFFFEVPFKSFDYNFLDYKSYFVEPTRLPFLDNNFYFPRGVAIIILIRICTYLGNLCVRRYLPRKPL